MSVFLGMLLIGVIAMPRLLGEKMMQKHAFRMRLNPGMAAEYRKRHDEIRRGLVALLKAAGVEDYSIHLDLETGHLLGVMLWCDDHGMDALPLHPVMRRWSPFFT